MFVIHIGLKKSGSSSIQTFLAANEEALRSIGVDYSPIGRMQRKAHHNLASEAMIRRKFNAARGTLGELAATTLDASHQITLISSEMFEGCEDYAVDHVKEALAPAGRPFRVILVIRELIELITSRYAQKIRYGYNNYDFDTFIESKLSELRVNYFETASRWAHVFGWENIRIRPLDPPSLLNGDLIDDFLDTAGVDMGHPLIPTLTRPGIVNAASGWKTLEALRALHSNRHGLGLLHPLALHIAESGPRAGGKEIETAAQEVAERLGWGRDKSRYLTASQAERTMRIYAEAVTALNEKLTHKLPPPRSLDAHGFVEREFLPDVAHIPPDELRTFYDGVAARFFSRRGDSGFSSNLIIEGADGKKPGLLLRDTPEAKPTLLIEAKDFYQRDDQAEVGARFSLVNGVDAVDIHFTPPGFLRRSAKGKIVKLEAVKQWAARAGAAAADSAAAATQPQEPFRIVSLADGRTLRGVSAEHLQTLSERIGAPVSFEQIRLPPTPILLSDAVFLDYFLDRARDAASYEPVSSVMDRLRGADVIVIDDVAELQWPMMRCYPVLSHRLERSPDADLLAYRSRVYTALHDRLPVAVVNGSSLAADARDFVIDAFSKVLGTPVFRVAVTQTLAGFTRGWDFRPLSAVIGGTGQAPVKPGDFVGELGDWIERRIGDGTIRAAGGTPGVELVGEVDFRPFDCQAADRESLTRVLDAFDRFCITGPTSSVTLIRKYLTAAGKSFVRAGGHGPRNLKAAGPFDCLLCCGSTGPIDTLLPAVAVMSAGWPSPAVNLPPSLSDIPPRGRVPTCDPDHWYSPLPPREGMTGPEREVLLEIAKLTREQRGPPVARDETAAPVQGAFEAVAADPP